MPTIFIRLLLFLSSYFPLTTIFFFLFLIKHTWLAIASLTIGTLGLVGMAIYLRTAQRLAPVQVKISNLQIRDNEEKGTLLKVLKIFNNPFLPGVHFESLSYVPSIFLFLGTLLKTIKDFRSPSFRIAAPTV